MPELPEVETIARGLALKVSGRRIEAVELARPDVVHGDPAPLCALVRGRRIEAVERLGKRIRVRLERGVFLHIHLGMTGRLLVVSAGARPEPHTHLRLRLDNGSELRFSDPRRFGGIWVIRDERQGGESTQWIGRRLAPVHADPLELPLPEFRTLLARRRQVKALLMAQEPISGIGNIYCDEALYRARIHPLTRCDQLKPGDVRRLWRAIRQVLRQAIEAGGSSIRDYRSADNEPGGFQKRHRVYDRAGQPCGRCRSRIMRLVVAGRGTFICPVCQKQGAGTGTRKRL